MQIILKWLRRIICVCVFMYVSVCVYGYRERERPETDSKTVETWVKAILKFFIFFFADFKYKIMSKKVLGQKCNPNLT